MMYLGNNPVSVATTPIINQIDDTAGLGDYDKTFSADKITRELNTKYEKPQTGIPDTDMATAVQTSLGKANTAYQKPTGGIPASDIESGVVPDVSGFYTKPSSGIPATDLTSAAQTSLGKADTAYQKPSGGIPASDIASGVIPDVSTKLDAPSTAGTSGQMLVSNGNGGQVWSDVNPTETVTGSTPSITGAANKRYVCGEVSTLSITPPNSGIMDVMFTSGTTPTVLTVPNTVTFPAWFDPTSLEASTTYEINILDGVWAVVALWQ